MKEMSNFQILWILSNKAKQVVIRTEEKLVQSDIYCIYETNYRLITEYLEILHGEDPSLTSSILIQLINMFKNIKTLKLDIDAELN